MPSQVQNNVGGASTTAAPLNASGSSASTSTAKSFMRKRIDFEDLEALLKKNTEADAKALAEKQERRKMRDAERPATDRKKKARVDRVSKKAASGSSSSANDDATGKKVYITETFQDILALSAKNDEAAAQKRAMEKAEKEKREADRKAFYALKQSRPIMEIYVVKVTDDIRNWEIHVDMHQDTFIWKLKFDKGAEEEGECPWFVERHQLLSRVWRRPRDEDILVAQVSPVYKNKVFSRMQGDLKRRISNPNLESGERQLKFHSWIIGTLQFINVPVDVQEVEASGSKKRKREEEKGKGKKKVEKGERAETWIGGPTFKPTLKKIADALKDPKSEFCAAKSLVDDDKAKRAKLNEAKVAESRVKRKELEGCRERRAIRKALANGVSPSKLDAEVLKMEKRKFGSTGSRNFAITGTLKGGIADKPKPKKLTFAQHILKAKDYRAFD